MKAWDNLLFFNQPIVWGQRRVGLLWCRNHKLTEMQKIRGRGYFLHIRVLGLTFLAATPEWEYRTRVLRDPQGYQHRLTIKSSPLLGPAQVSCHFQCEGWGPPHRPTTTHVQPGPEAAALQAVPRPVAPRAAETAGAGTALTPSPRPGEAPERPLGEVAGPPAGG